MPPAPARRPPTRRPPTRRPPTRRPLPSDPATPAWTVVAHLSAGPAVSPMSGQRDATRLFDRLRQINPFVRIELFCAGRRIELHSPSRHPAVTPAADA